MGSPLSEVIVRSIVVSGVRSGVRSGARSCLVAFLIASLLNLPAMAASERPLGMVVASQRARVDNASAVAGATVYAGDAFVTDAEGSLRLKIGGSQVYLLSSSAAKLVQQENKVHATVDRGTLGFSTATPDQIEIETPLATVRGMNGERVFGQVAVTGADQMTVSAYEGTLLVAANDQEQVIKPGQKYTVSFAPDAAAGGQEPQGVRKRNKNKRRLLFLLIMGGAVAGTAAAVWHSSSESCSTLPCN
jgi:hypothetical protein